MSAQHIWALVSGLPSGKRERRLLLMLQAYIDESYSSRPDVYALAGFVSTAERWAAFSNDWQQILEMKPRLRRFKMSEAMANPPRGEFYEWSEERRDERLRLLMGAIADHAILGIGAVLQQDVYERVFAGGNFPKPLTKPYFFLLHALIGELASVQHEFGFTEKIDFIFDDLTQKGAIIEGWDMFKLSTLAPRDLIGSVPTFRNDEDYLPLQAADLHAWLLRDNFRRGILGEPYVTLPSRIKGKPNPPSRVWQWKEEGLRAFRQQIEENWAWVRPRMRASFPAWDPKWTPFWGGEPP